MSRHSGDTFTPMPWRGFVEAATIREWEKRDHRVQRYTAGKCAVATYLFSITFSMGGQMQIIKGRGMFFLIKEEKRWFVVADQFSPEPLQV